MMANRKFELMLRTFRCITITISIHFVKNKNHFDSYDLNKSVLFIYLVFQVCFFESILNFQNSKAMVSICIITQIQDINIQFVCAQRSFKIAVLAVTYLYFATRYFFKFNENPIYIIDKENISILVSFFALKYIIMMNHNKYRDFMESKFY